MHTEAEEVVQTPHQAAYAPGEGDQHPRRGAEPGVAAATDLSFIETQFPISKLSKESYLERKSHTGQTLTSLGKWWGRKPLILVRAIILGLLMPASRNPRKDREIFLALLTMDEAGLRRRKRKALPLKEIYKRLSRHERADWFVHRADPNRPKLKGETTASMKDRLQRLVFDRLSYDEKLKWCARPEHVDGPDADSWRAVNEHLGTSATSLPALIHELGTQRFGHVPRIGDAFCGGGSIPFEAARIGCDSYGSDLNPVAALLTWGSLEIIGGGEKVAERIQRAQSELFEAVDEQITSWRIEHNDVGWRADAFLYCTEATCPECEWRVPLAPSWAIGQGSMTVGRLVAVPTEKRFRIEVESAVDDQELEAARNAGTVDDDSRLRCPNPECEESTSIASIRGDAWTRGGKRGLRPWESDDVIPRPNDTFQERLYCIRWRVPKLESLLWAEQEIRTRREGATASKGPVPEWVKLDDAILAAAELLQRDEQNDLARLRARDWFAEDEAVEVAIADLATKRAKKHPREEIAAAREKLKKLKEASAQRLAAVKALNRSIPRTVFRTVDDEDLHREAQVIELTAERLHDWQKRGYIPRRAINPGEETSRIKRERGWTHWHHLFTPRQLLIHGLIQEVGSGLGETLGERVDLLLGVGRSADWDSKLCRWGTGQARESIAQSFYNQAFNTLFNFPTKGFRLLWGNYAIAHESVECVGKGTVAAADCREVAVENDIWITDPPYADAVNYHELSEFLLAWYETSISNLFPVWYADSKRALAVRGSDADFRHSMVESYRNLTSHMPENGLQVVMFTHQDAGVWADLTLILWAAGLRVSAAWTIATETDSAMKQGNYVQGTVVMVLRKQTSKETVFLDELMHEVDDEVEEQLKSMLELDDTEDPNFSDADYQLAAYAAALRVLTKHGSIEDIDVAYELARKRSAGDPSPIEELITGAVRTASNFLIPNGLPGHLWRQFGPEEKLYLKGLEIEGHGDFRTGVYQEFARGFGVRDYRFLLHTGQANQTRLKTASEFKRRELGESPFGRSIVRHALYAVWRAAESGETADSLTWLRTEVDNYWGQREALAAVLRYLARVDIEHWSGDTVAAHVVAGAVENDHV